jgi:hypothetical protein
MSTKTKERKLVLVEGLVFNFSGYLIEIYEDLLMVNEAVRFVVTVRDPEETEVHVMLEREGLREQAEMMIRMLKTGTYPGAHLMFDIECILGIQENGRHQDKFGKYTPEAV